MTKYIQFEIPPPKKFLRFFTGTTLRPRRFSSFDFTGSNLDLVAPSFDFTGTILRPRSS